MIALTAAFLLIVQDAQPAASDPDTLETAEAQEATAEDLVADINTQIEAYADIAAEIAARRTRESFATAQFLSVLRQTDLAPDTRSDVLAGSRAAIDPIEAGNTAWALAQLNAESFPALYADQSGMAEQILAWARRDPDSEGQVLQALEPVALAGTIDGASFAQRFDAYLVANQQPQRYGTAGVCVNGSLEPGAIDQAETLAERRLALGLPEFDTAWAERVGTPCED